MTAIDVERDRASPVHAFIQRAQNLGGIEARGLPTQPTYQQPIVMAAAAPVRTGPTTVLDEKLLKVTLNLAVVKLLPAK